MCTGTLVLYEQTVRPYRDERAQLGVGFGRPALPGLEPGAHTRSHFRST